MKSKARKVKGQSAVYPAPEFFIPADTEHIKKERQIAKTLKKTRWWRNKLNKGKCYYCEKKFPAKDLSMEHLTPLARWGKTIKNNVVTACKKCNQEKNHKTLVEIRLSRWPVCPHNLRPPRGIIKKPACVKIFWMLRFTPTRNKIYVSNYRCSTAGKQ